MSGYYSIKRRKARKEYTCIDSSWAHDRTIKPGDYYCHVVGFSSDSGAPKGPWPVMRFCDDCGADEYEQYKDLIPTEES